MLRTGTGRPGLEKKGRFTKRATGIQRNGMRPFFMYALDPLGGKKRKEKFDRGDRETT